MSPAPRRPDAPIRYRVLWIDAAGEGRFTTVDAKGPAEAAFNVARDADSTQTRFEAVSEVRKESDQ